MIKDTESGWLSKERSVPRREEKCQQMEKIESFSDLKLNSWIIRQCEAMGM
jgi:hypothetical protein